MDPIVTFGLASGAVGFLDFGASILQWMVQSRETKARLSIEDYIEWLRRENHAELLERVEANRSTVSAAIECVKDAVLGAIFEHEANSEKRHAELQRLFARLHMIEVPNLRAQILHDVRTGTDIDNRTHTKFRMDFSLTNLSPWPASIQAGSVMLSDGGVDLPAHLNLWIHDLPYNLAGGAAMNLRAETGALPLSGRAGRSPQFQSLTVQIAQDGGQNHVFVASPTPAEIWLRELP